MEGATYNALRVTALIFILLFNAALAFSAVGEAGPAILKMNFGSRLISMGGAFVGLADDPFYMDSNPAGGQRDTFRFSLLHQEWIEDVNHENFRFTAGFDHFFMGIGYTFLYMPFTRYDSAGAQAGNFTITEGFGTFNAGLILNHLSIGTNLKLCHYNVPGGLYLDQNDYLFTADFGALLRTNILKTYIGPEPSLVVGASIKNAGVPFLNSMTGSGFDKPPTEIHVGSSFRTKYFLLSDEAVFPLYEPFYWCVGLEANLNRFLFLSAGLQYKEDNPMLGLGAGVRLTDLYLYASYTPRLEFRNMFTVSMSWRVGETRQMQQSVLIKKLFKTAYKLYEQKEYDEAEKVLGKVLEMDPKDEMALSLMKLIRADKGE
jgi:hypothetical protein